MTHAFIFDIGYNPPRRSYNLHAYINSVKNKVLLIKFWFEKLKRCT